MTAASVRFETTISGSGNKAGIVVPDELVEQLGAGRRPAVHVQLGDYSYRTSIGVMGGACMVPVSQAVRKESGLTAGDAVTVTLTVADTPREVQVPDDLAAALTAQDGAEAFFAALPNSLQRYHVDLVNDAKTPETRARRIDKALALFAQGKKR